MTHIAAGKKNEVRDWLVFQLGAREHYAIPRALHAAGRLKGLFTDAWVPPRSPLGRLRRCVRDRHHPDLPGNLVEGRTARSVCFELMATLRGWRNWERIMRRNGWFEREMISILRRSERSFLDRGLHPTLYSFSYTALAGFRFANDCGWRTVLGQIDGGLGEERHIADVYRRHGLPEESITRAPSGYWRRWREECHLAETIIANSEWSRDLLGKEGVSPEKIRVIPLAYDPPEDAVVHEPEYPEVFKAMRPLRVLFLGQIGVRKGALEALEAARIFNGRPVEFHMVGPVVDPLPSAARNCGNVRWHGSVSRSRVKEFYRRADVFLFPTHSDGFGLTQLEAQAWKMPLIASRNCGRVVRHDVNGWELGEVSPEAISEAVETCLKDPGRLAHWSRNSSDLSEYSIFRLSERLLDLS